MNKVVEKVKKAGVEVFLDLKFLDIPNTVANACRVVTNLGINIINIHAIGGLEMMKAEVRKHKKPSDARKEPPLSLKARTPLLLVSNNRDITPEFHESGMAGTSAVM